MTCDLTKIRAIYFFPEAYEVNLDGTKSDFVLGAPPAAYQPNFLEFYCTEHDCTFKRWKAVLSHIGEHEMVK